AISFDAVVSGLAWSPNGRVLVSIQYINAPRPVAVLDDDGNPTKWSFYLQDSTIKVWDAKTGKLSRSLDAEKDTFLAAIAMSPDGKTAAVSAAKHHQDRRKDFQEVRVMDSETWTLKHKVKVAGFASALAFSPDGTRLALGGSVGRVP